MEQEILFRKYYQSLTPEEVSDEILTLSNIKLSVDFYEYICTDPEKLLAIIHFNNLEDKYGIRVVFDNDVESEHSNKFTDHTGNMSIIFRFNNDVYRISTMVDSVTNNSIYDSFTEQISFILGNHKSDIISREEEELKQFENDIKKKHACAINLMWYVLNSPIEIKEMLEKINKGDYDMNNMNKNDSDNFSECNEDATEHLQDTSEHLQDTSKHSEHTDCNERNTICPAMTVFVAVVGIIIIKIINVLN